jgi:5-hydroxyisourate hydrolase-like protein (transthyretin family)
VRGDLNARLWCGRRGVRVFSAMLIGVLAGAVGMLALASSAFALGAITGTVTDAVTGKPISDVSVEAYSSDGSGGWISTGEDGTGSDGTYHILYLAPGTYRVKFSDVGAHVTQYYRGASLIASGTDIPVSDNATASGIDASMQRAISRIAGVVTDASSGKPLSGINVEASAPNGSGGWDTAGMAWTDANGAYTISQLPAATYRVLFHDGNALAHADQYYHGASTLASATDIPVAYGATVSGINATMALGPGPLITGTVTDFGTGKPIQNVTVEGYWYAYGFWSVHCRASSDASGNYVLGATSGMTYRVKFTDPSTVHFPQYYSGATLFNLATDIPVSGVATFSGVDAVMRAGSCVTGTVVDAITGKPVSGIDVNANLSDGNGGWALEAAGTTDASGTYQIHGLTAGTYRVQFIDNSFETYATQFYKNTTDLSAATDVPVSSDSTVTSIDASLTPADGSRITGTVTDAHTGKPIPYVAVTPYASDGMGGWINVLNYAVTDASGTYVIGGLEARTYHLKFTDGSGAHAEQFYHNAISLNSGTDVVVSDEATVSGIDEALDAAACVTGTVTDVSHNPIPNVDVTVYRSDGAGGWVYLNDTFTDTQGGYTLGGLAHATYRVGFHDWHNVWMDQFYSGAGTVDSAADIPVSLGATMTGISAELVPEGSSGSSPPTTTILGVPTGWVNHDVTFSLTALASVPGTLSTYYGENAAPTNLYSIPVLVSAEGTTVVQYRSVDASSNWEGVRTSPIRIDKSPPVTTCDATSSYSGPAAIHLRPTDSLSGVAHTYWVLDAEATQTGTLASTSAEGSHTLTYYAVDVAGNVEATHGVEFHVAAAPKTPTSIAAIKLSPSSPKRRKKVTFTSSLSPGAAAVAVRPQLALYHQEKKTVVKVVRGKRKKVKVTWWHLRATLNMTGTSAGKLSASTSLSLSGTWRAQVAFPGTASFLSSASGYRSFKVK